MQTLLMVSFKVVLLSASLLCPSSLTLSQIRRWEAGASFVKGLSELNGTEFWKTSLSLSSGTRLTPTALKVKVVSSQDRASHFSWVSLDCSI